LNPRYFASGELAIYLKRLMEPESELTKRISALRKRPRRTKKPLWNSRPRIRWNA